MHARGSSPGCFAEQRLFERLSVFAGGFVLDAAEAVGEGDVLGALTRLVAKSMVQAEPQDDRTTRYRLLEPLRQFAREELVRRGELEEVRRRHAAYVLALAERAAPEQFGPDQVAWFRRMEAEWDNVRAAHDWAVESGETETALRLAAAFWWQPHRHSEGRARLAEVLALPGAEAHPLLRARVQGALALASLMEGDLRLASSNVNEALTIGRDQRDISLEALALSVQAGVHLFRGELDQAEELFVQSLEVARRAGLRFLEALRLQNLAQVLLARGDLAAAEARSREAVAVARAAGDVWSRPMALTSLGDVLRSRGEFDAAGAAAALGPRPARVVQESSSWESPRATLLCSRVRHSPNRRCP